MRAGALSKAVGSAALIFLLLPLVVVVAMSFSSASSLQFPPPGFSFRWYEAFLGNPRWIQAVITSSWLALVSSVVSVILGGFAAYGLTRGSFRGASLVEANLMAPLILPAIVLAVALYLGLARMGLLGSAVGLIVAHVVLSVPYAVFVLTLGIKSFDERIELIAATLGAPRRTILTHVVLPNILPSIITAWVLCFITSFDEVIVTLFISGTYETVPKKMFNELVLEINPTITAIATLLVVLSLAAIGVVLAIGERRHLSAR